MKQILWFIKTYFTFVILFSIQKPFFMILEKASATQPIDNIWSEMPTVMWYGLSLDLSMAGYLTALPGLLLIAMIWFRKEIIRPILNAYYILASFLVSITFVLNAGLYPVVTPRYIFTPSIFFKDKCPFSIFSFNINCFLSENDHSFSSR